MILQKRVISYFIIAVLFFLVPVQSVKGLTCENTVDNSGPSTVLIKASLNKDLFAEEKKCLNENCSFFLDKYFDDYFQVIKSDNSLDRAASVYKDKNEIYIYNSSSIHNGYRTSNSGVIHSDEAGFLNALEKLIEDDISEIEQILIQEMDRWAWIKEGNKLIITKYSPEKEKEFADRKKQFRSCFYFDYKRVGNWLFTYTGLYDHCYFTVARPTTCVNGTAIQPIGFFVFLLTNMSIATIPYLIPYLIVIFIFGRIIYLLIRRKEFRKKLWIFLKPSVMRIGITIVMQFFLMFVLLLVGIFSLEMSLCLFFFSYFVVSSINRIYFTGNK